VHQPSVSRGAPSRLEDQAHRGFGNLLQRIINPVQFLAWNVRVSCIVLALCWLSGLPDDQFFCRAFSVIRVLLVEIQAIVTRRSSLRSRAMWLWQKLIRWPGG